MGIQINLDGSTTDIPDNIVDEQQSFANELAGWQRSQDQEMIELRKQRDQLLLECDWTQASDSPLDSTTKTAWATYRQKLRDLTSLANAPNHFLDSEWPIAPGKSELPEESMEFVRSNLDPVGLGTTSWVVSTTGYVELNGPPVYKNTPSTRKTIIFEAPLDTMQGTVSIGDTFAYNGESCTITGVAATSITLATGIGATIPINTVGKFLQQKVIRYKQNKPEPIQSVSVGSTIASPGTAVTWTYKLENIVPQELPLTWELHGAEGLGLVDTGTVNVGVSSTTSFAAVYSVTVDVPSDLSAWKTTTREINVTFDVPSDPPIGKNVGITT